MRLVVLFLLLVVVVEASSRSTTTNVIQRRRRTTRAHHKAFSSVGDATSDFKADPYTYACSNVVNLFGTGRSNTAVLAGASGYFTLCPITSKNQGGNVHLVDQDVSNSVSSAYMYGYFVPYTMSQSQATTALSGKGATPEDVIPHVSVPINDPPKTYVFTGQQTGCATLVMRDGNNLVFYHDPVANPTTFYENDGSPKRRDGLGRTIVASFAHADYNGGGFGSTFMYHTSNTAKDGTKTQCWNFVAQRLRSKPASSNDDLATGTACPNLLPTQVLFLATVTTPVTQTKLCMTGGNNGLFVIA